MTAGAYPGFCSIKRLGILLFLLEWDASPSQVPPPPPPQHFAGTHLYSWVERDTVRVKCLAQEHNTMTRPGLEPGPPDLESSALTTKPPRFPKYMYQA